MTGATAQTELALAIDECLFQARVEGRSRDTIKTYGNMLAYLERFAAVQGVTTPGELSASLLRAAATQLLAPDSPRHNHKGGEGSVRGLFSAARYFARWAAGQGIQVPDLSRLKRPRLPRRVQPRVSADEFRRLESMIQRRATSGTRFAHFTSVRDLALLYVLTDTGLRISEVCALDIGDIDLGIGAITVRRGKGGKGRALSIRDAGALGGGPTLTALRTYLERRATCHGVDPRALWVSVWGHRFTRNSMLKLMTALCAEAGIPSRAVHSFRRAHFTEQYNADPSALPVLVARMGWASLETDMVAVYTRGAMVDLARTQPRPSIVRQWRADAAPPTPTTAQSIPGVASDVVALVRDHPDVIRALLQAMHGAA